MTSSLLAAPRGAQVPRVSRHPDYEFSEAEDAILLAGAAGLVLDDWQRYVLERGLGRANGKWSASRVGCWVPRQNGKGGIIEALELFWLFGSRERLILHSAHEYKTAQEAFLRIRDLIQACPDLDRMVNLYRSGAGEQGIELTKKAGGSRLRFVARSNSSGRGFSGDKIILDEGQYIEEAMMAAMLPTLSARPDPQVWFFGTPPEKPDAWVYGLRSEGETGKPRLAWFDWGTDLNPLDPHNAPRWLDRDLWFETNPAAGIRIDEETIEDESGPAGLGATFPMERLGAWLPYDGDAGLLDAKVWAAMADAAAKRAAGADIALAFDVTPLRDHASIALYSVTDSGRELMQLIDHRPRTDWLVDRLVELRSVLNPICLAYEAKNGAHAFLPDLKVFGIVRPADREDWDQEPRRGDLLELDTGMAVDAVGQFIDGFRAPPLEVGAQKVPRYVHADQEPLNTAVKGAVSRPVGDGGQIAWGRKASEVNIGPLQAITEARYGYLAWKDIVREDYDVLDSVF